MEEDRLNWVGWRRVMKDTEWKVSGGWGDGSKREDLEEERQMFTTMSAVD